MERVYTTPLLDKLGIGPGMRVAIIEVPERSTTSSARTSATERPT